MIGVQCRRKVKIGIGFTEVKPPFNHNYSIMPNINTSVDDLLLKSYRRRDCITGSSKPVPLTADPVETSPNIPDDSQVCADSLNDTGLRRKNEERSAGRSTESNMTDTTVMVEAGQKIVDEEEDEEDEDDEVDEDDKVDE
ncbi:hypothetical protein R6Q57_016585 [Mikania cordata]